MMLLNKNIGIIDADLLDYGTRHPNLALEKISGFYKNQGHSVNLLLNYENLNDYDQIFLSRVFDFTKIPIDLAAHKNITWGGTGFYFDKAPDLPYEIEHHMPDYHLYDEFVEKEVERGIKNKHYSDYLDYSIGFMTRGCFRKCDFCVNRKYSKAIKHSPLSEFYDPTRKYIYLWDDNILAYEKWHEVFDELQSLNVPFQFKQGLDIRLMTEEKAKVITSSKYHGDYIFAFDSLKDKDLITNKLKLWKIHCSDKKNTKLYVLCGYENTDISDVISTFERIKILMKLRCLPYIMRHKNYEQSEFRGIYITLARWCNQPSLFKKKSFREFCNMDGQGKATLSYYNNFVKEHPELAEKYFDLKYSDYL